MAKLPDGIYDAIVIEAEQVEDGGVRLELTITLGAHIGRVIALRERHVDTRKHPVVLDRDPVELLGVPGTLTVRDGTPSFRPEVA
jgi:hypothetical protein